MRGLAIALVVGCGGGSSNGAAVCGDGIADPAIEECDDGNLFDGDGCSAQCRDEGCGDGVVQADEQCDDGNSNEMDSCTSDCVAPPGTVNKLRASWHFESFAAGTVPCPPGVDTAVIASRAAGGAMREDMVACADESAAVFLPAAVYSVHIDFTSQANPGAIVAESLPGIVDLRTAEGSYDTAVVVDGGYFELAWQLIDADTQAAVSCAAARVTMIEVVADDGIAVMQTDRFQCVNGRNITAALPEGAYQVTVRAIGLDNIPRGMAQAVAGTIGPMNQVTQLGDVAIPVEN